ncbi:BMC domain-containing protein [Desulforamulus ferrireducens]|uniref:BMC domain protein n=1 Tax=Desulforamulus ferrireducens TaxID=1833852 RepID=A0A1S6ISE4_9FIRM|nr:BMC domain-containing protein [Desulforamulus ferrireducens]AQS57693.1 BMC domain protein [Desulforamulus ferrireducens]
MQALGLIETKGLLLAITCADVMLKTAQVELVERTFVGSGLVTISVTGDVAAVKAAVEAGVSAVEQLAPQSLVSHHVIPRPHSETADMFQPAPQGPAPQESAPQEPAPTEPPKEVVPASTQNVPIGLKQWHKEGLDAFVKEYGLENLEEVLNSLAVVKLRNLAREYKDLGLAGRAISKANKELLIQKLMGYYQRG